MTTGTQLFKEFLLFIHSMRRVEMGVRTEELLRDLECAHHKRSGFVS